MELTTSADISVMDRGKIQAQVLLPLVRALREEIGEERTNEVLRRALGEPELGAMLHCASDFPMAEVGGPAVEFTRSQTLMQGETHCDFCYRIKR